MRTDGLGPPVTLSSLRLGDLTLLTWLQGDSTADQRGELRAAYGEMLAELRGSAKLLERVYGDLELAPGLLHVRREVLEGSENALPDPTYVAGTPATSTGLAGIQIIAARPAADVRPQTLSCAGVPCGRVIDGSAASYLALSNVDSGSASRAPGPPHESAADSLAAASAIVTAAGWSFRNIVRTWFHLDGILEWYDEFNQARNTSFERLCLGSAEAAFPASTAVGGCGLMQPPCTLDVLAIRGREGQPLDVRPLNSPCQGEARTYGSAFSRGISVTTGQGQILFVSGTAAIDLRGTSLYPGNFVAQVVRTVAIVRELLESEGATLADIGHATAFIKRPEDASRLEDALRRAGCPPLPLVATIGDICRDELLFELDATALRPADPV